MYAKYIPALKYHFLTPIYDWFIRLTMPEIKVKRRLIRQAQLQDGQTILDFGCGTATLTLLIEEQYVDCVIIGLDTDPQILAIAKKKISQKKSAIALLKYEGGVLPFPNCSFDKVLSSWVFHHLTTPQKIAAFKEINRVLKPQGELHIADWGEAETKLMRLFPASRNSTFRIAKLPPEIRSPDRVATHALPSQFCPGCAGKSWKQPVAL